jgi:hypothetical protein
MVKQSYLFLNRNQFLFLNLNLTCGIFELTINMLLLKKNVDGRQRQTNAYTNQNQNYLIHLVQVWMGDGSCQDSLKMIDH